MSVLVILLPPRPRGEATAEPPAEYAWALSSDGRSVARQGRAPAAALPRADQVCAALPDADISWQRVAVPKAPAARLRAALGAVLEEQLLDDDEAVHLALEPGVGGGQTGWVAVTHKAWLAAVIADLERAGVALHRVLPLSWPDARPHLHVMPATHAGGAPAVVWSHADGVTHLGLAGNLARQQLQLLQAQHLPCSAHPSVVEVGERWLNTPMTVLGDAERALQALHSPWNLRQFDLAPRHRGLVAVREALRRAAGPEWRPVRIGLVALVAIQLVGVNAWAWHLDRTLSARRQATVELLKSAHPQVRSVLDPATQMQTETDRLRSAAGRPGPADLEPMLSAAAAAWPDGQPPLSALRFEGGRLTVTAAGWGDAQRAAFAERLRAAGYEARSQGEQTTIGRAGGRP